MRQRLRELAAVRVRYGYRRLQVLLQREGWRVNHKRVYRLYREEGLAIRMTYRKKRASAPRVALPPALQPNERWSIDFLTDSLVDGRPFRVLALVDNVSRVSPAIEVDFSMKLSESLAAVRVINRRSSRISSKSRPVNAQDQSRVLPRQRDTRFQFFSTNESWLRRYRANHILEKHPDAGAVVLLTAVSRPRFADGKILMRSLASRPLSVAHMLASPW